MRLKNQVAAPRAGPIPDAPPTRCHGRLRPHGHVAVTRSLQAPSPITPTLRAGEGTLEGRSCPHSPLARGLLAVLFAAHVEALFPWAPGRPLAGHQRLSPPLGRHPKAGLPRPRPASQSTQPGCVAAPRAPLLSAPFRSCPRSGFAELAGGAKESGLLRASGALG